MVLIGALAGAGCGAHDSLRAREPTKHGPPVPLPVNTAVAVAGEQMTYSVSLRGIEGGEAVIASGQPGVINGRRVMIVRSRVESAGLAAIFKEVRDDVTTHIDVASGYPVYQRAALKFGARESEMETSFKDGQPGSFRLSYQRKGQRARTYHQKMPAKETVFDGHSVIGALRGWRPTVGQSAYFYILAGKRLWKNTVRFTGVENVKTPLGKVRARRYEGKGWQMTRSLRKRPKKRPREYVMYVSDDVRALPLLVVAKTEYGAIQAALVDYQSPAFAVTQR